MASTDNQHTSQNANIASSNIAISLHYDEAERKLYAVLKPSETTTPWSNALLLNLVKEEGYEDFKLNTNELMKALSSAQENTPGTFHIADKPEYCRIHYRLDNETAKLYALLTSSEDAEDISTRGIQEKLAELGFNTFYFEPNTINSLAKYAKDNAFGEYPIAEKRNAQADISFDDELMHAYITITPPFGGRALDSELLSFAIKNAEVDDRACDKNRLKEILDKQEAEHVLFASGKTPKDGIDTQFEALVEETVSKIPTESANGKIDTKDVLEFTIIEPGIELMRRIPPVEGINGFNVKGQAIPAIEGIDIPFNEELIGAKVSEDNPNLLISTAKGHPVILKDGVKVDKTLTVNNVALSTGHITFDGSLLVRGEVMPGMKINVTGDIIVEGVVTNAILRAKNNITVKCGVIGADPEDKEKPEHTCILKAGGDITAQYISQTKIIAGHDLIIKEYVSHCNIDVKHQILAGMSGGKGRLFGGDIYAQAGIKAKSVGAEGVKTTVISGSSKNQQKQYDDLIHNYDHRQDQLAKLEKIFKKQLVIVKERPADNQALQKAQTIKKVVDNLKKEISKIKSTVDQVEFYFKKSRHAEMSITSTSYPDVHISINGAQFIIRKEGKGGRFIKQGKDIRWLSA